MAIRDTIAALQATVDAINKREPEPELKAIADDGIQLLSETLTNIERIADALEKIAGEFVNANAIDAAQGEDKELAEWIADNPNPPCIVIFPGAGRSQVTGEWIRSPAGTIITSPLPMAGYTFARDDANGVWHAIKK